MYGQRPAFWFNLKASSGALSIRVPFSHMNLAHVVGAMIVVDRCGDGDGIEQRSLVLSPLCQRICSCIDDLVSTTNRNGDI